MSGGSGSRGARTESAVRAAGAEGLVTETCPVVGFIDLEAVAESQAELESAFAGVPAPILHTFAAKASSLVPVLRLFAEAGMGCEVASRGELAQALAAGFAPELIVFDAPTKTTTELRAALRLGVAINADNFTELERIDALLRELEPRPKQHSEPPFPTQSAPSPAPPPSSPPPQYSGASSPTGRHPALGLRINPQIGTGSIEATSTASPRSKFGVPLRDEGGRQAIIAAFERYPWLSCLHVHVGSQGCPLELMADGVRQVYELAEEINGAGTAGPAGRRVTSLDIGGGLPVNFDDDRVAPTFAEYVDVLRTAVPGLFDGRYELVTEFGRSLIAKNGFTLARVEYTKQAAGRRIALTHAGAQVATRTVLMPESWPLRVSAFGPTGEPKHGPLRTHDVAGPCCFAGDLIATGREMPQIDEGDLVLLHDTGGYAFTAMWTYNNLPRPAAYGFSVAQNGDVRFTQLRRQETLAELVATAGGDPAVLKEYVPQRTPTPDGSDGGDGSDDAEPSDIPDHSDDADYAHHTDNLNEAAEAAYKLKIGR